MDLAQPTRALTPLIVLHVPMWDTKNFHHFKTYSSWHLQNQFLFHSLMLLGK